MIDSIKLRSFFPWLIAAALLYVLFQRFPLPDVLAAARLVQPIPFVVFVLTYFIFINLADGWSLGRNLAHFGAAGSAGKAIRLRMAANLAMVLNYGVGQGVLAFLIRQHYRIPFARSTSILIFQMLNDLYLTLTISFVGSLFTDVVIGDLDLAPWIRFLWAVASLAGLTGFLIIRYTSVLERVNWVVLRDLFHTFHESGPGDYVRVMARRFPLLIAAITYLYFLALCFGVHIPLDKIIALMPLTIIVGAIPITPSGLGVIQLTEIYLFQSFVSGPPIERGEVSPGEIIFAFSMVCTIAIYLLKVLSGLVFYRYATDINNSWQESGH